MDTLPWDDVSAREAEVLGAVGEHLTNAQIAARLHISARTVESHVSALLRKCGVGDRRQLAALAAQVTDRSGDAGLPEARTSFVGRAEESAAVRAALDAHRLVTLTGPGGVGKTRLAVAVADAVAGRFPAGVTYVDLVPVRAGQVVTAVAAALGVTERPPRPLLDGVADRVRRRTMLLMLDNCEHVLDEAGELVDALLGAGRQLSVLATSRERLGIAGEAAVAVPSLPLRSDAEALFVDRVLAVDPAFGAAPSLVTEACARLDGLPLAIELAAARAAAIGIDGLLTALEDQLRAVTGARGGEARHHSLREVLGWSHELLDPAERALFRTVSVFAAGFDLDAAVAVATGEPAATVAHLLGRLVEKSLVTRRAAERTRYRLLETVRAFATERLRDSGEEATVRRAHLEWASRASVESADPEEVADDLRAALARSEPVADPVAHRLARALARMACVRGDFAAARAHFHAASERATTSADAVRDLHGASEAAQCLADGEDAFALLLAAADHADTDRDRAVAEASAVIIANRFEGDFRQPVPAARRTVLLDRAESVPTGDPAHAAILATARTWQCGAPPDVAVTAARATGDPILLQGALDSARSAAADDGDLREAYRLTRARLDLIPTLTRTEPATAIELFDLFHSAAICALAVGDLPGALAIADRATAEDPVNADFPFVSRMKYLAPLALSDRFTEAVHFGETAYAEWHQAGRPPMTWLSHSFMAVALAPDGALWRDRALEFAGVTDPRQSPNLMAFAAFVDAANTTASGDLSNADLVVQHAFADFPQPWFGAYAHAAGAELAVCAGLPGAADLVALAERSSEQNDWAAERTARAKARLATGT